MMMLSSQSQNALKYQLPPKEILELADIRPQPAVRIDSRNQYMVLLERYAFKTLEELAQDEVKLAGLRINPQTNGGSRSTVYYGLDLILIASGQSVKLNGLPENPRFGEVSFSPDDSQLAFTNTTSDGIELWVLNLATGEAKRLTEPRLNGVMGFSYEWGPDSKSLYVMCIPEHRRPLPADKVLPIGPSIQETTGSKAPVRTYQDMLRSPADEARFDYYAKAEVQKVSLDGTSLRWLEPAIYSSLDFSPDGNWLMATTVERPYSYIVPFYRFPANYNLFDGQGKLVKLFYAKPLVEEIPTGFDAVEKGKRSIGWRADKPATLVWAEAQDEGDPAVEASIRDKVYIQDAPFTATPVLLAELPKRYSGISWANDNLAVISEYWWKTRRQTRYLLNPSVSGGALKVIFDLSSEDVYADPGDFIRTRNQYNRSVLHLSANGKKLWLNGEGCSPEGNRPFLDEFDLKSFKTRRLWRAEGKSTYENIIRVIDPEHIVMITTVESPTKNPDFWLRKGDKVQTITKFANPYASFSGVSKQRISYKRADGVDLTATLYLPAGYDKVRDGRLPVLMWAYPQEFKNADQAGQVKESPYRFVQLYYGSPVYWAARGYAIVDDADFPVIGEGTAEPNDSFIEQLVDNAAAAIKSIDEMGVGDPHRVAIGGHSYGAFMTANLMAHCDLFAAGIARSGAYNRTLTPFGFQAEERTFWQAPEVYMKMSPFVHADKINEPLLMIHGDADNNSGTFTLQSERLFSAIKGLGGTARLVLLPFESHGYAARENILHMLWETDQWLEKYVKNRK
ncbi:MAG TPA: S9 family peptidase [Bacteroidales bacterium]|nr:S9 family peptidase [Bacteroidales bacterium]HBZ68063.1 S9 family peptidase [Bacteroidales bacterium]